jgi:Ca2+-binding EF-hand superfamily protein
MLNQQELQNLQAWFTAVDKDRSGSISAIELAAMPLGNGQLGLETAQKLIKAFDKDYSGAIGRTYYLICNDSTRIQRICCA